MKSCLKLSGPSYAFNSLAHGIFFAGSRLLHAFTGQDISHMEQARTCLRNRIGIIEVQRVGRESTPA